MAGIRNHVCLLGLKIEMRGVSVNSHICRICQNAYDNELFLVSGHRRGTSIKFEYMFCGHCKSIQLLSPVINGETLYNESYYSFSSFLIRILKIENRLSRVIFKIYSKFILEPSYNGTKFKSLLKLLELVDSNVESIGKLSPKLSTRILDVGCGGGGFLLKLRLLGFYDLTGIDPYLPADQSIGSIRLFKNSLDNHKPTKLYDLIFLNHSLEHLANPVQSLLVCKNLLSSDGTVVVSIPLVSYAYYKYKVNWHGIDAPSHIHIFSPEEFMSFVKRLGFVVQFYYFNSLSNQFVISEKYASGDNASLNAVPDLIKFILLKAFSPKIRNYIREAQCLNENEQGDQAVFFLR